MYFTSALETWKASWANAKSSENNQNQEREIEKAMDIGKMNTVVSGRLGRDIDAMVWQYFAGLPEYWECDVVELLAVLFEYAESDITSIFDDVTDQDASETGRKAEALVPRE
jgi:hypothetical protein